MYCSLPCAQLFTDAVVVVFTNTITVVYQCSCSCVPVQLAMFVCHHTYIWLFTNTFVIDEIMCLIAACNGGS